MNLTAYSALTSNTFLIISALILIAIFVGYSVFTKTKLTTPKTISKLPFPIEKLIIALGGKENIKSCSSKLSKLYVVLEDYSKANAYDLKKLGASGILKNAQGFTIIFGQVSSIIEQELNKNI